jgi:hypothetical protein
VVKHENLASPMMFGIRSIPLGKDSGLYGNFALRQFYTSFGTDTDCGPACVVMAASHYRSYITPGRARDLCKTDLMGANLAGMTRAFNRLGLQVAYERSKAKIEKTLV